MLIPEHVWQMEALPRAPIADTDASLFHNGKPTCALPLRDRRESDGALRSEPILSAKDGRLHRIEALPVQRRQVSEPAKRAPRVKPWS